MDREELIDHIKSGLEPLSAAELIEVYSCGMLRPVQREAIKIVLNMTDTQVREILRRAETT